MPKTITVTLQHDLPPDEVKRRITNAILDARAQHPELMRGATERWTENQMDFVAKAMGQTMNGRVVVEPKVVHMSLDLPLMLAMFAGNLKPQIEAQGRKLLES